MKLTKRLLAMLLLVCMVFSMLPAIALTASVADVTIASWGAVSMAANTAVNASSYQGSTAPKMTSNKAITTSATYAYYGSSAGGATITISGLPSGYKTKSVSFYSRASKGGNIAVSYSTNGGSTYTNAGTSSTLGTSGTAKQYTVTFSSAVSDVTNIKFVHSGTSGSLYFGTVSVTGEAAATKTLSSIAVSSNHRSFTVGGTFVKETVTATYSDSSTADVTNSATFSGYNMNTAGTQTVTASYTEGGVTKTATYQITVAAPTPYTLTYSVNGDTSVISSGIHNSGSSVSLPATVTAPADYTFSGWVASAIGTETTTAPAVLTGSYTMPAANTTLYALFTRTDQVQGGSSDKYELVTSASSLAAGDKLLIVGVESGSYYALKPYVSGNNCGRNAVSAPVSNVITTTVADLTLGGSAGAWTLFDGTYYLYAAGGTGSSNYLKGAANANNANAKWTISFSGNNATIKTTDSTVARHTIMHNIGSDIFSCYASGQAAVSIYKQKAGTTTTTYYTTTVQTPAVSYTLTYSANPAAGGTITCASTSGASIAEDTSVSLTAAANTHYTFTGWTVNGASAGSNATLNLTMDSDKTVVANFTADPTYTVTITPAANGTMTASKLSGIYAGETITLTATPDEHYTFNGWQCTAGGATISNNSFTMPAANVTITGSFTEAAKYTVTFSVIGDTTAIASVTDYVGTQITLPTEATVLATITGDLGEYEFAGWAASSTNGSDVTTATVLTGNYDIPASNTTLYAVFTRTEAGGSAASLTKMAAGGTLADGDKIVVVANDTTIAMYQETYNTSYVNKYTFSNNINTILEDSKNYFTVNTVTGGFTLGDATNGYLYNSGSNNLAVDKNSKTTWTLTDKGDGTFNIIGSGRWLSYRSDIATNYWKMGGSTTGTASGTIALDLYKVTEGSSSTTYYNTDPEVIHKYTLTVDSNIANGSVTATAGEYEEGDTVTLSYTADTGYQFDGYVLTKDADSSDVTATYISGNILTMPAFDVTLSASFSLIPATYYSVTPSYNAAGGSISVDPTSAEEGDEITVTISPNTHWTLTSLTVNGAAVDLTGITDTYTFELVAPAEGKDVPVVAVFTEDAKYTVTIDPAVVTGGTLSADKTADIYAGETVTLTATPDAHYTFDGWQCTAGGATISGNTFTMPASNVTLSGSFTAEAHIPVTFHSYSAESQAVTTAISDKYYNGDTVLAADVPAVAAPNGYVFMGWYGSTYAENASAPAYVTPAGTAIGSTALNFYAVYGKSSAGSSPYFQLSMEVDNTTYYVGTHLSVGGSAKAALAATDAANAAQFGIDAGGYLYYTDGETKTYVSNSSSTTITFPANTASANPWTVNESNGTITFASTSVSGRYLAFNNDNNMFDRFASYTPVTNTGRYPYIFTKIGGPSYDSYTTDPARIAPELTAVDDTVIFDRDRALTFNVLTNDDLDYLDATGVTVTVTGILPTGVVNNNDGTFTFTPSGMQSADITFSYTITDKADSTATATAIVTLKPAAIVYYDESDSGVFTFAHTGTGIDWMDVTDANFAGLAAQGKTELDSFVMYSGGSAKKATVSAANNKDSYTVSFSFAGTGFDLVAATTGSSGSALITVKQGNVTIKTALVDTYRGYTYAGEPQTVYMLQRVDRYKAVTEDDKTTYEKYDPMLVGAVITDYTYIVDKENGGYKENTTWYLGEPGTVKTDLDEFTEDLTGASSCIVVVQETNWIPNDGQNASNGDFYQIPVFKMLGLSYGTYDVTVKVVYTSLLDHDRDGSYEFIFDGVNIHDPVENRTDYRYIDLRQSIIDSDSSFGSVMIAPCEHETETGWTFFSAASGTATGEALNRGSFVKRCTVCGEITDTAYFNITTSANPTTIATGGTSTLSYTLTSDNVDVQTILTSLTNADASWRTADSTILSCSKGVATGNGEGSTYATLSLKVGNVQYASAVQSPTITVANSQPGGYTATFHVPAGATAPAALTGASITLPAAVAAPASCDAHTYTFAGWVKSAVAYDDTAPAASDILAAGESSVTLDANTDFYALYSYEIGGGTSNVYQIVTSAPTDWSGKYIIVNPNKDHAMSNTLKSGSNEINASAITVTDNKVVNPSADLIWELTKNPNNASQYSLYNAAGDVYAGITGTSSTNASLNSTENFFTIEENSTDNVYDITSVTNSARCFSYYGTNETFRTYAKSSNNTGYLFKQQIAAPETYYTTNPGHKVSDTGTATAPTCTQDGYTGDVICSECGMKLGDGDAIPALGHNYEITSDPGELNTTYTCSVCHDIYIEYYEYAVSYALQPGVTVSGGSRNVNQITLPTAASIPATYDAQTYSLVGWANATSADGTTDPSTYATGAVVNINADTTFYPVYSFGSGGSGNRYTLVSSLTSGNDYIFVSSNTAGTAYALDAAKMGGAPTHSTTPTTVTVSSGATPYVDLETDSTLPFHVTTDGSMGNYTKYKMTATVNDEERYLTINGNGIGYQSGYKAGWDNSNGLFGTNSNNTTCYYAFYSNDHFDATGSASGRVYAYEKSASGGGTTTYTFELQALEDSYSVTLNPTMLRMDVESTANLTATLYNNLRPVEAESVEFSSSDSSIVLVDENTGYLVAGNTAGNATITVEMLAADGEIYSATCTVTVREKSNNITVNYIGSATGKVYNWGTRGTVATFLTAPTASYYTGSYSYETLFAMSGDSGTGTGFYTSQLGSAIHNMLVSKQTTQTIYDGTKNLYAYTDCIESDTAHTSGYYTGKTLSSTWDSGSTWNREHVWPSSKCINTNHGADGADIMMLRPESASDNSGRGNTAFGESSSYYNPDAKYPNKAANVRGDVARNVLYTLMRWGNTTKFYGTNGVIESRAILIKWMDEDPVDTWELARNDAAQRITGVRNIFVDYPELAYKLLGATMPTNYTTPSSSGVVAEATYSATRPSNYEPVTEGSGSRSVNATRSASAHRAAPTVGTITGAVVIDGKGNAASLADYKENGPKYGVYLAPGQALVFTLNSEETVEKPTKLQIGAKALNGRAAKLDVLNVGQLVTPMLEKSIASATEQYYDIDVSELGWNGTSSDVIVLYNDGEGILDVTQLRYPTTDGTLTLNVSEMAAKNAAKMLRIVYGIPETAPDPIEPTDLGLNFKSAALVLNSDISMNFYVEEAVLNSAKNVYAVFTKALYNEAGKITGYEEKTVTEITQSERGYAFRFDGINPAEMGSAVTATLYGYRDGELISGETVDYSVLTYVNNMFVNSNDASFKTLLADLVNYGAAAQTYVSYNTANLVTANVADGLMAYATTDDPTLSDCTSFVKNDAASVVFTAASLSLRDKVTVRYELDASDYEGSVNDLALHITYVDIDGKETEAVIPVSSFEQSNGKYLVSFSRLNAVQMRTVLHASVYAGDICVSDTLAYSIESYASAMAGGGDALANLVLAMMRYGDSAAKCFRK